MVVPVVVEEKGLLKIGDNGHRYVLVKARY